jgi:hypothetical protein
MVIPSFASLLSPRLRTGQADLSSEFVAFLLTLEGPADDEHLTKKEISMFVQLSDQTIARLNLVRHDRQLFVMAYRQAGSNSILEKVEKVLTVFAVAQLPSASPRTTGMYTSSLHSILLF